MIFIKDFIFCILATVSYSILMSVPKRAIIWASSLASIGYIIYDIIFILGKQELLAYFTATLFIAIAGEGLARILKMSSIMFIFPAIIPLVPGIGLYRTMLMLVENDFNNFLRAGTQTLFIAGSIAAAIAVTNLIARAIPSFFRKI
ncbi:MAG: threonine/serine exporter [Clostridia bacterium]|jgi:uncharacterized membrane protein YjjB (DUF3815 family)|nr:threonine/serine exporter [Clostridia bacterium]